MTNTVLVVAFRVEDFAGLLALNGVQPSVGALPRHESPVMVQILDVGGVVPELRLAVATREEDLAGVVVDQAQ